MNCLQTYYNKMVSRQKTLLMLVDVVAVGHIPFVGWLLIVQKDIIV